MSNKNNNLIFQTASLLVMFAVVLVAFTPKTSSAYTVVGAGFYALESNGNASNTVTSTNGGYTASTTPKVTTKPVAKNTTTPAPTVTTEPATKIINSSNTSGSTSSNLSANVSSSSFSFMPNSFLGWLSLFVLILLAVLLWRKIYVTDQEKHAPLKHA